MNDGWIILDKPDRLFSKTASGRIAHIFGTRKHGHIGTLDPMATGVLPIALGNATKMIPFIEDVRDKTKEYLFSLQFGFETDTLDITGRETVRNNIIPTPDMVRSVLHEFVGRIFQIPPMFSAVHIDGRRAYEIARTGHTADIPPRTVDIYSLELLEIDNKHWNFVMSCSPGTYVRSVARDIAARCGTLATVDMIRRTQSTGFTIKNALTLDFLEKVFNNGDDVRQYLAPVDFGLGDIPVLNLDGRQCVVYRNGGFIETGAVMGLYRVYSDDKFVGIGTVSGGLLRPKRTI